ncbi:uncharacterized protein LOC127843217 [Dreissena polymorpha]|uniref:uncharacterized protein LOC127843217 n=1 Tax=Dreissena polymorpha TaxID=45954 RepID=UPI0022641CF0|nr:uncharacterized protein LOC127843217 [Dreissena polymorpha]
MKELKERCIRVEKTLSTEIGTLIEELSALDGDILKLKKKIRHAESEKMKLIIQLREKEEEVEQLKQQRDLLQKRYNKMKEANFMLRNEKNCYKGTQERSTLDKILEMETSLSTDSEKMARRKELFRNLKFEKTDNAPLIKLDEDMSKHRIAVMDMFCAKRDIAHYTGVICLTLQGRSDLIQEILKTSNLLRSDFDATSILLKKLHEKSNEITTSTIPVIKHAVDGHERKLDIRPLTRNVAEIETELSKILSRREEIFIAIQENIVTISSLKRKISAVNQDENHIQRCASTYIGKVFQEQSTITKFWYKLKAALMYIGGQGKLLEVYRKHIEEETYSHRFLRLLSQVDQNWQVIGEMCSLSCGERNKEANVLYSFADNIVNVNTTT